MTDLDVAGSKSDIKKVINTDATACAAGSMFNYYGPYIAVLINYLRKLLL
ncbi:Uncharacterised protein [uncultured archaeon]|nr:Uncharacterised protein [uncultured archaeon]